MPVTNDKYDQLKIDKLKHFLEAQAAKGQAKPFEIFVDNLKVVAKTEDVTEFDSYEYYMNEDTEKLRILIYNSNLSPRNDQYCFLIQNDRIEKPGNGLGEIEGIIQEKLAARDREYELTKLKEELDQTKQELKESEDYAENLEAQIENLKANKFKFGNINVAELAGVALESIVRRNPQLLARIPGGETLAGIIEQDNREQQKHLQPATQSESAASFEKETSESLTEDQRAQLAMLKSFEQTFTKEQAVSFNEVLQAMVEQPTLIPDIIQLIHQKQ